MPSNTLWSIIPLIKIRKIITRIGSEDDGKTITYDESCYDHKFDIITQRVSVTYGPWSLWIPNKVFIKYIRLENRLRGHRRKCNGCRD